MSTLNNLNISRMSSCDMFVSFPVLKVREAEDVPGTREVERDRVNADSAGDGAIVAESGGV